MEENDGILGSGDPGMMAIWMGCEDCQEGKVNR